MKRRVMRALGLSVMSLALLAPAQADDAAERARIARERAEAQARFEQRQRECAQRFAVTHCVEEARAEHRQALLQLRQQEGVLDEAQRKQRAAARLAAIEEKRRAERERAALPRAERQPAPLELKPPPRQPAASARPASVPASDPDAAVREQRKRARFEARQRDAQVHREEAERRSAERESKGKAGAPLPDPAAR